MTDDELKRYRTRVEAVDRVWQYLHMANQIGIEEVAVPREYLNLMMEELERVWELVPDPQNEDFERHLAAVSADLYSPLKAGDRG